MGAYDYCTILISVCFQDIRSYFTIGAAKKPAAKVESAPVVKRKAVVISSDEEDVPSTPKQPSKHVKSGKKKRRISDSDDDVPKPKQTPDKKPNLKKLSGVKDEPKKAVDVSNLFGGEPNRVERPKPKKSPAKTANEVDLLDDDFDASIAELADSQLEATETAVESKPIKEERSRSKSQENTPRKSERPKKPTPKKETPKKQTPKKEIPKKQTPKKQTPKKESPTVTPKKEEETHRRGIKKTPLSDLGLNQTSEDEPHTSPKRKASKKADLNSSATPKHPIKLIL